MKKQIKYTDEPMGDVQIVKDFLPAPDKLVFKEDNIKVTIALSKSSVSFFKKIAKQNRTPYQAMIRRILSLYAEKYSHRTPNKAL